MEANNKSNKFKHSNIDEASIMNVMAGTTSEKPYVVNLVENTEEKIEDEKSKAEQEDIPSNKEEKRDVRKKKPTVVDYETLFICPANIKAKTGKTIYLRPEYHRRIARILQLLEDNSISLTDYVDNVFAHHFQQFEQDIRDFCTKNNDPII